LKVKDHLEDSGTDGNIIIRGTGNTEFENHTLLIIRIGLKETKCGDVN
jgi:hypothetical protein